MDIAIKRASFGQDDQSWLGSAHGTNAAQTITLDVSTFTKATHYPDGYLKSGLPLQKLPSGKFGLWLTTKPLAGFLFTPVSAPADSATPVGAALLEHGRVIAAKLPVSVDAGGQTSAAGRIIFA
ncbi:head decoration protein [Arthrobacter sp. FW306-2-2C-D06B]|uniref:head decoration protein n=1 Tax=Arthrobacter sp. FW306-2-2C-D06B TaxID=2879618 RepID=UPI001F234535|nr:head decoration protein [Arthrobacter sp. FW306-2-2C-D06B]UKA59166.1 head decoration protein [Arthrobacter sp. FW306-2-2C-D06B]